MFTEHFALSSLPFVSPSPTRIKQHNATQLKFHPNFRALKLTSSSTTGFKSEMKSHTTGNALTTRSRPRKTTIHLMVREVPCAVKLLSAFATVERKAFSEEVRASELLATTAAVERIGQGKIGVFSISVFELELAIS